jgi:hypothetical protein
MGFRLSVNNKTGQKVSANNRTRSHAKTLVAFWLQSLLGVSLVTFLAGAALVYTWTANEKADALDQLQGWGAAVVHDIEKRVASLRGRLRDLGADPQLRAAFAAASAADHRAGEKRLERMCRMRSR